MHSAETRGRSNIPNAGRGFASSKFAAAKICGTLTAIMLSALLIAAHPAQAQTEAVLYNFASGSDGGIPQFQLTSDGAGNFYGTTFQGGVGNGGVGYGTAFKLSPNGAGGWTETVIHSFAGRGGENPSSPLIFDSAGNLYGTTSYGGAGYGVVFELSPVGKRWKETVLHTFAGTDGANPASGLIFDTAGNLYGTTLNGPDGDATVFELSPSDGLWTEQIIYSITQPELVGLPNGLIMDGAGNIFGTTYYTVFELLPNGSGGWNPAVLHNFAGGPRDGAYAVGTLVLDQAGNLYGTTQLGGAHGKEFSGFGTVYELSPGKKGWKEKILHSFEGGKRDGIGPVAGIVFDASGNIYGTTYLGGESGLGTVFELVAPVGTGKYEERVFWNFNGTDGSEPFASLLLDGVGKLYGTTLVGGSTDEGGASGYGVVFEVTP
ncbi:MAG: choice-of-anchor tandem repeat GloVer-containing protein [Terriglobales bacterium]|jgi:hypothetical protein